MWEKHEKLFLEKTKKSKEAFERAGKTVPGGESHIARYYEPYPVAVSKAQRQHIWDADGNRYTDYWMGHTSLILGHSPKPVVDAVLSQIPNGTMFGYFNEFAVKLTEKISKVAPCAEMVKLATTGAEVTMYSTRLARAYTGKRIVVKIAGGWHGYSTNLMEGISAPFEESESLGILNEDVKYVRAIPFNDIEASVKSIHKAGDDLACIIMEPLLGSGGCIPADKEYLKAVEEEVHKHDGLLIFDEIITGFRLALGGAQEHYGMKPDLATYAKIMGGGFPAAAIAGRQEVMSLLDATGKKGKGKDCKVGGGTFSCNPTSMVAGLATLEFLEKNREEVYGRLGDMGKEAREGINNAFKGSKLRAVTTGAGSLLLTHFLKDGQDTIRTSQDHYESDLKIEKAFYRALMSGFDISFLPGHVGAISYSHTMQDVDHLVKAAESMAQEA